MRFVPANWLYPRKLEKSDSCFMEAVRIEEVYVEPGFVARERQRARKLRQKSWWKRKLSQGSCYYCGRHFTPQSLTMDHIIPLAKGGRSVKINVAAACKKCNNAKKNLVPNEWESYLERLKTKSVLL